MSDSSTDPRMSKILALLAKAESTTFPEEAKSYMSKAQELMTRWAIDDAMLAGASTEQIGTITKLHIEMDANEYKAPRTAILSALCRYNDVKIILDGWSWYVDDESKKSGRRRVTGVTMVGFERDLKFCETIWASLLIQAEREFNTDKVQEQMREEMDWEEIRPNQRGGFRIKYHNSFMRGFSNGLDRQLAEARRLTRVEAEKVHGDSMAIVLVSRENAVAKAYEDMFPDARKTRSSAGYGSAAAEGAGRAAGRRADVGRSGFGGNRKELG